MAVNKVKDGVFEVGGMVVVGVKPEQELILKGRDSFIERYCKDKGWDRSQLSMEQILEIRKQDGWKNAGRS